MSGDRSIELFIPIDRKFSELSKTSQLQRIFRVHNSLRSQNEQAYEPQVISIGPYHRRKSNLQELEKCKHQYVKDFLERAENPNAEKYIKVLSDFEEEARSCYSEEHINLSRDEFVEMIFVDGCFIIEFLWKLKRWKSTRWIYNIDDPVVQKEWLIGCVVRDLMLFENQLPFFILVKLFDMPNLTASTGPKEDLIELAISALDVLSPDQREYEGNHIDDREQIIHLLDLMHRRWCSAFAAEAHKVELGENICSFEKIKSASELLQTAGIKFEKADPRTSSWLDITFKNGVMKIPPLYVGNLTECVLRNLVAYEQYFHPSQVDRRCVVDYVMFMDILIDSSRDVEKLRHRKIITKWFGDDEAICSLFNKLGNEVNIYYFQHFRYWRVFLAVDEYCRWPWHTWWAELKRKYFSNPWSAFSLVAAVLFLLFAACQTIFSILQYVQYSS